MKQRIPNLKKTLSTILMDLAFIHVVTTISRLAFWQGMLKVFQIEGRIELTYQLLFNPGVIFMASSLVFVGYYTFCLYFLEGETFGSKQNGLKYQLQKNEHAFMRSYQQALHYYLNIITLGLTHTLKNYYPFKLEVLQKEPTLLIKRVDLSNYHCPLIQQNQLLAYDSDHQEIKKAA